MTNCMSVADSAYHTVHSYPGGAAALQVRMGKSNLSAEVNPNIPTAKLGLEDAVKVQALSGDHRILLAMCMELGYQPPQRMHAGCEGAPAALAGNVALSQAAKEFGDVVTTTAAALADDVITPNELRAITQECGELVVKLQGLMHAASAMCPSVRAVG